MSKLDEKTQELAVVEAATTSLRQQYDNELETNPKFSLEVDPENKYNMQETQKQFIKHYVEFKNVNTAAELAGIDQDTAKQYFIAYSSQQEIRRINLALCHRQFSTKLLTLDQLGGYLTSMLTGENVPLADQLKPTEKLKVIQMLIDLNLAQQEGLRDPSRIMFQDIDVQIRNLSVAAIGKLLKQSNAKEKEPLVVEYTEENDLTPEESAYLSTLSTNDILQLLNKTTKENKGENE